MVELAASTGMSVAMAVLGPLGPTVVRLEESARPLHVSLRVGTVMSLVNTAIGRVFAAHVADDVRNGLLAQDHLRLAGAATAEIFAETPAVAIEASANATGERESQVPSLRALAPEYAQRLAQIRAERDRYRVEPARARHQHAGGAGAGSHRQHLSCARVDGAKRQFR